MRDLAACVLLLGASALVAVGIDPETGASTVLKFLRAH